MQHNLHYPTQYSGNIDHMRKLQKLIATERSKLSPYSNLSSKAISRIASKCRKDEIADAHILIKELKAELATLPDWDGDTHDDIWRTIELFKSILDNVR
ncbi:hypothetical protein [Orbus mooreae]|uniref:hypothetical protein n=1 Tax=Orbus mooreae TaxID=3074107 RepID=UPI00370D4140